jgi:protein-S-isoprenylcysteine O-methyltransferase Ste14
VKYKVAESNSPKKLSHFSSEGRAGEHPYGDRGQLICLLVFLVIWMLDSFVLKFSTFLSAFVSLYIRLIAAGLISILAIYLVRSGHRAVSHDVISSSQLLTDGAFARVRHPLYLASLLFYVFLISLTLSLISLFIFICIFIFYNYIARYEERYLEKKFGQDYLDYKKNVPKWIPRL